MVDQSTAGRSLPAGGGPFANTLGIEVVAIDIVATLRKIGPDVTSDGTQSDYEAHEALLSGVYESIYCGCAVEVIPRSAITAFSNVIALTTRGKPTYGMQWMSAPTIFS